MFKPLYARPQQMRFNLSRNTNGLPDIRQEYRYIPKKFHGQIVDIRCTVKTCVIQQVRPQRSSNTMLILAYYPEYGYNGTLRVLTPRWKKVLRKHGVRDPKERRCLTKLAKHMCRATLTPGYRERAMQKPGSRKRQKEYQELLKRKLRFKRPKTQGYIEATMTIRPFMTYDVLVDVVVAYDPFLNVRSDVRWSIDNGSWRKVGLTGSAREQELNKLERACHHFRTNDLLKQD